MKRILKKLSRGYRSGRKPKKISNSVAKPVVPTWTDATGRKVPVVKLETRHLVSILRFLHRRKLVGDLNQILIADANYGDLRKEHEALDMIEQPIDHRFPIYKVLKNELSCRMHNQTMKKIDDGLPF